MRVEVLESWRSVSVYHGVELVTVQGVRAQIQAHALNMNRGVHTVEELGWGVWEENMKRIVEFFGGDPFARTTT